jgi:predicted ester cyclase
MNRTATLALALMIAPVALLRPAPDGARASSSEDERSLTPAAQRMTDAWLSALNDGALARLDGVVADTIRLNGRAMSRQQLREMIAEWRARPGDRRARAFPLVTDGDVVGLWTWSEDPATDRRTAGIPSTDRVQWLGADFLRVEDGEIVEGWLVADRLGLELVSDPDGG